VNQVVSAGQFVMESLLGDAYVLGAAAMESLNKVLYSNVVYCTVRYSTVLQVVVVYCPAMCCTVLFLTAFMY